MEETTYKIYEIHEVLAAAAEWAQNPENTDAVEALENIKNSLVIKDYMPLKQKELCLNKMLIDIYVEKDSADAFSVGTEIAMLFDCLLGYVVNLNQDIDTLFKDTEFYDLLYISGIVNYILGFCQTDYNKLEKMADRMISYDNLKDLIETFDMASPDSVKELTEEFKRFRTDTKPDMLKHLGDIMAGNDPLLARTKKTMEDGAFNAIKKAEEIEETSDEEK